MSKERRGTLKILNEFDAVRYGTYEDFLHFYSGDINTMDKYVNLNLLSLTLVNDKNELEKLKIIKFLLSERIDINFKDDKFKRNALHWFYFSNYRPSIDYMLEVTKLLINGGIDINALDKYKVIPLKYAITITKLPSNELKPIYEILLKHGSNYKNIDVFGKTCLDYVKELSWRNDVIKIIKEFEDGNKK